MTASAEEYANVCHLGVQAGRLHQCFEGRLGFVMTVHISVA